MRRHTLQSSVADMPRSHTGVFILVSRKEDVNQRRREVHRAVSIARLCQRGDDVALACVPCLPPPLRSTRFRNLLEFRSSLNLGTSTARASIFDSLEEDITIMFLQLSKRLSRCLSTLLESWIDSEP
jgi:hypothetical protein